MLLRDDILFTGAGNRVKRHENYSIFVYLYTECPKKYIHNLKAYNSPVNNDGILHFTGI
jgi:hypothetical protein